jgi:hypothetical protein
VWLTPRPGRFTLGTETWYSLYSAVHSFWPVEELEELADGPSGCEEVARGGSLCAWNFSVTRSTVIMEAEIKALVTRS